MRNNRSRRLPRFPTSWAARFRLDPEVEWRTCRLTDVSWAGASLDLDDVVDDDVLVGPIYLELKSTTDVDDDINVRSQIRHSTKNECGQASVGVSFKPLREEQARLFRVLIGIRAL
jgi:hypothetical protein